MENDRMIRSSLKRKPYLTGLNGGLFYYKFTDVELRSLIAQYFVYY